MSRSVYLRSWLAMDNLVITRGAAAELTPDDLIESLTRHLSGDWGDLDLQDLGVHQIVGGDTEPAGGDLFYL